MKHKWLCLSAGVLSVFSFNQAVAWNKPGAVTVTLAGAYYHFDHKRDMNNSAVPNAALAYNFDEHWAIEGSVGSINTNQDDSDDDDADDHGHGKGVDGMLYMIDGIYRLLPYGQFEPYVLAGIGVIGLKPNDPDPVQSGNLNAGIGTQIFFGDMIALRGEFRDIYATTGSYKNDFWLNFGLSFQLGGPCARQVGFKGE